MTVIYFPMDTYGLTQPFKRVDEETVCLLLWHSLTSPNMFKFTKLLSSIRKKTMNKLAHEIIFVNQTLDYI